MVLLRTNSFADLDRVARGGPGADGSTARASAMPMDAWREDDVCVVEFDVPGVDPATIDLDVERKVITVHAERIARPSDVELIAAEQPRGAFSRQLVLGDNLDTGDITASCDSGVLTLRIPVAARARGRKIPVSSPVDQARDVGS